MAQYRRIIFLVLVASVTGCSRQDADALANIGDLLAKRVQSVPVAGATGKLIRGLPASLEGEKLNLGNESPQK